MKHSLLVITALAYSFLLFSQSLEQNRCPYKGLPLTGYEVFKEAEDFTITTTDGISRNLYNTLDSGKTVFVDLFYTTCYYCQLYAPIIEEIYQNTGAGAENIEFWGISNNLFDTNWVIDQYKETYDVSNPCAGPWGGGTTAFSIIVDGQNFYGFPTYVVICPDRTMYFDPCYPPTVEGFDPYFESCSESIGVEEGMTKSEKCIISVYPNPSSGELNLGLYQPACGQATAELYNILGTKVYDQAIDITPGIQSYEINVYDLHSGTYFLRLIQDNKLIDSHKVMISR